MSDLLRPSSTSVIVEAAVQILAAVRVHPPLTHCITNSVVTNFTANTLLALGAAPAMVDIVSEAGPFATVASATLINLGTPTPEQQQASREAAVAATAAGTPWVLDPVAIGALPVRTALAHELLALRPTVIRGNASEIIALAGAGNGGRGVDALDTPDAALAQATSLACSSGSVIAVSGAVDLVTDGVTVIRIANGDALLTRVTGGGCALGAVMAAFLAAGRGLEISPLEAVAAAALSYAIAAERAAAMASRPGSFAVAFLDAIDAIGESDIRGRANVWEQAA